MTLAKLRQIVKAARDRARRAGIDDDDAIADMIARDVRKALVEEGRNVPADDR